MARRKNKRKEYPLLSLIIIVILLLSVLFQDQIEKFLVKYTMESYSLVNLPEYQGQDFVYIDNNKPTFSEEDYAKEAFESYSKLDFLGRCGVAYAKLGLELMPKEERESISSVNPTGFINVKYNNKYLYNRCHLIGFQLAGENANERNLITCTEQANQKTMVEFENKVASYIKETHNHVMYRVTPIFEENNLVASGIQMEAYSVEDKGKGIEFNVYIFNVQDGVTINYKTGESWANNE